MNHEANHSPRVLAIDLRPQQFGYAVFEGDERLLDWGAAYYRPGGSAGAVIAGRRVAELLRVFAPTEIVVRQVRRDVTRNSFGVRPILKVIRRNASAASIPVSLIGRNEVREAFRIFRAKNKYEIACRLAAIYRELLWWLPPERKFYESEHPRMTIFDAVATGFTYWRRKAAESSPPD
jgi:hypothetical protein